MSKDLKYVLCDNCGSRLLGRYGTDFWGFRVYKCQKCSYTTQYPLKKEIKLVYWMSIVFSFISFGLFTLGIGGYCLGLSLLLALVGMFTLPKDSQIIQKHPDYQQEMFNSERNGNEKGK